MHAPVCQQFIIQLWFIRLSRSKLWFPVSHSPAEEGCLKCGGFLWLGGCWTAIFFHQNLSVDGFVFSLWPLTAQGWLHSITNSAIRTHQKLFLHQQSWDFFHASVNCKFRFWKTLEMFENVLKAKRKNVFFVTGFSWLKRERANRKSSSSKKIYQKKKKKRPKV